MLVIGVVPIYILMISKYLLDNNDSGALTSPREGDDVCEDCVSRAACC